MNKHIIQTIRAGIFGVVLFAFAGEALAAPTLTPVQANNITNTTAVLIANVGSPYKTSTVWFEWGESSSLSPMTTAGLTSIYNGGFFQAYLSNLTPGTTYYYRAVAMEGGTTVYSSIASFVTTAEATTAGTTVSSSAPLAATYGASAIAETSATLNGYVVPNDSSASAWFEWGNASYLGYTTSSVSYGNTATSISHTLWGLSANTTYYYRVVVSNLQGISRGSTLSFTTNASGSVTGGTSASVSIPSITTNAASSVSETSATLNGYVIPNGSNTSAWFDWGSTASFGSSTPSLNYGTNATSYNSALSGLNATTTYYYRAVANNTQGTVYGSTSSFTTGLQPTQTVVATTTATTTMVASGPSPAVTTLFATELTGTGAKLNGLVSTSADQSSNAWFEWGTSSSLGNTTQSSNMGMLPVAKLSDMVSGLISGQTYYYRIVADNPYGKVYGAIISFVSDGDSVARGTIAVANEPATVITKPTVTAIISGSSDQALVALTIDGGVEAISVGEKRSYHVVWENKDAQSLKNVVLRATFPQTMNVESATSGAFSGADNVVTVDIKTLAAGEVGETTISVMAGRGMKIGEVVVISADMVYTTASGVQGDAIAYVTHRVADVAPSELNASIFGAGPFIPTTLLGWVLLVVLVLILVLLGNHLYGRFSDSQ